MRGATQRIVIVADTTPISELAKVGRLELLRELFGTVIIPDEVYGELTVGNHPAAIQVPQARWIIVRSVEDREQITTLQTETDLDLGECAAMILARELPASQLLIDDLDGRKIAQLKGLQIIGTVGIVLLAKENGFITTVKEILDALIGNGMWISRGFYAEILAIAQEH